MSAVVVHELRFRDLDEAGRAAWRAVVEGCPHATVFHTPEWLDVLEETFEPDTRCLLAWVEGRLAGVFPFFTHAGPWPGRTHCSCLRERDMVYGGPVAYAGGSAAADDDAVLSALLARFEAGPLTFVARLLPPPGFPGHLLEARRYRSSPHLTALIDLNRSSEALWGAVHSKTRNMIRKARSSGLRVRAAAPDDLRSLPAIIAAPFRRAGRTPPPPDYIHRVARDMSRAGLARVLVAARDGEEPVAASIFLHHRRSSYYWAGGALARGYETAASHLVQWEGIEAARAEGCDTHDLVMVDPITAPGIARFKLRFGARLAPLCTATRRRLVGRVMGRLARGWSGRTAPGAAAAPVPAAAALGSAVEEP